MDQNNNQSLEELFKSMEESLEKFEQASFQANILESIVKASQGDAEAQSLLDDLTVEQIASLDDETKCTLADYYLNHGNARNKAIDLYAELQDSQDQYVSRKAMYELSELMINSADDSLRQSGGQNMYALANSGFTRAQYSIAYAIENRLHPDLFGDDDIEALYWFLKVLQFHEAEEAMEAQDDDEATSAYLRELGLQKQQVSSIPKEAVSRLQPKVENLTTELLKKAELGDQNAHTRLNNYPNEVILTFHTALIERMIEHFCMSTDTHSKADILANWVKDNRLDISDNWSNLFALSTAIWSVDQSKSEEKEPNLKNARTFIHTLAQNGYAPALYWQGYLVENNISFSLGYLRDELSYYKEAAAKGIHVAKTAFIRCARKQNRCQHCGGAFKGFFTKKCADCKKPKDY